MKKSFLRLTALALLVCCVLTLASCGSMPKPQLDLEEAEENLDDNDYSVRYEDDEDELGFGMVEYLSASNDKGENITICVFKDSKMAKLYHESIKHEYDSELEALELQLETLEYVVKKYEDDLDSDDIDDYEDEIKDLKDEIEDMKEEYSFGVSGKTVWRGTVKAVEDSKK